jgi:hypothetical protein
MHAATILAPDFQTLKRYSSFSSPPIKKDASAVDTLGFVGVRKQGAKKESGAV